MPARVQKRLDAYQSQITDKVLAGEKKKDIIAFLADEGINCSAAVLGRKIKLWRETKTLPPGKDSMQNKDVEAAALAIINSSPYFPTDHEVSAALKGRFNVSARSIRHMRMRLGLRRRIAPTRYHSAEDLVAAVILRLGGDSDGPMPKDDEVAEEMNAAGFDTSAKEIYSIRLKNKIKHDCRGANKRGRFRRVNQELNSPLPDGEDLESGADAETEPESEPPAPEPPKLLQTNATNIINLDADAIAIIQSITPPILKSKFDRLKEHPGVHLARSPFKIHEMARPLVENLLQSAPKHNMQVTAIYISNNMFVPDPLFGCWLIPLEFHRVKEHMVDEESDDSDDEDEEGREHWIDDINVRIGMALYVGRAVAVHCRMTALLLSR